jgi:hypothetical protein
MRLAQREYRAKAFDCLSRADTITDPEQRADMLRLAQMWMSLSKPLGDIPGAYKFPQKPLPVADTRAI